MNDGDVALTDDNHRRIAKEMYERWQGGETLQADEVTVTVTDPNGTTRTSRPPGTLPLTGADRPDPRAARCTQIALARARARGLRRPHGQAPAAPPA